jgi:sulfur-oxidizing protein SoxX
MPTLPTRFAMALLAVMACPAQAQPVELQVIADAIPEPLTATPGNASRGRAIVASRQSGLCLLCHTGPIPEDRFQGNLAPDLAGAGTRWSAGQLRLRIADGRRLNPDTIMPAYYRSEGLQRVAPAWRGKTLLTAQEIEDVVAYLLTLK